MSDLNSGTAEAQPADDIRSTLAQAFLESEKPDEPAEVVEEEPEAKPEAKPDRARDSDGKFAKKEDEPEPKAEPEVKAAEVEEKPVVETKEPPANWSEADKATFKALPEQGQKFLLDRHKAMEADYTKKTQAIAALKNEYEPVQKMFEPHQATLKAKGFTPRSLIEAWANVEMKLAGGVESATEVIKGLVSGYNIPPARIAQALGISAQAAQPAQQTSQQTPTAVENGQQVQLPPELAAKLAKLDAFEQRFASIDQEKAAAEQARQLQAEQEAENQAQQFKSAKDDKGELLHPYVDDVEDMMLSLARAAVASKQPVPSLKELYETAVYAHPETRAKVLTAQRQAEEKKRADEARAKAAAAKKAGSSVSGAPGAGQAPKDQKSGLTLREQLEEAANEAA